MDDWFSYILLVILIALSAFFSASETAYTTVNKIRLQNYVDAGSKKAKTALFIAENYDRTLTTILIGNNIVNIGASSIATLLFVKLFRPSGAGDFHRRYDHFNPDFRRGASQELRQGKQ